MRLNKQFLSQVGYLRHNHILILVYLYQWVASEKSPRMKTFEDGKNYFWIAINKIADDLNLSRRQVQNALYRLENKDKSIQTTLQPFIYPRQDKKENRLYISLNEDMIPFLFEDICENKEFISTVQKRLRGNSYNVKKIKEVNGMLFSQNEINIFPKKNEDERKGYSIQAECLIRKLVKKNRNLFTTRLPEDYADGRKTKTYIKACKTVQDIYNGNFNSRYYPLSEKFLKNKEFDLSDYKNKLQEVKGDWNKVKKLLTMAVENYKLMFEQDRMPTHKKSLTTNIQAWLYDGWNGGTKEPTAYFIYCLNEPKPTLEQFSNMKADKIYEKLPESVKDYGNNSIQLYFTGSAYPGIVWEHIKQIYEWGNTLLNYEDNARYWISKNGNIIQKFNEYLKEKNISVSINTFDIEKSTHCNGPWCWFISEAVKEHSLNSSIVSCVTDDDFYDCYNSNSSSYKDEDVFIPF